MPQPKEIVEAPCYKPGMRNPFPPSMLVLAGLALVACGRVRPAGPPAGPASAGLAGAARAIPSDFPFVSLEGPFWVSRGGYLIFSDVVEENGPAAKIYRFDPGPRAFSVVDYPGAPVSTNGLAVDAEGRLLACERWNGALARVSGGNRTVLADRSPTGATLGAPNDLTLRQDGNIYFTDTTWGARPGAHAQSAVYRLSPAGVLYVAFATDMPNGVALSPDGRTLYVGSDATTGSGDCRSPTMEAWETPSPSPPGWRRPRCALPMASASTISATSTSRTTAAT